MPTLTVRDIPDRVYRRLKELAGLNRRSMNNEIVTLLEAALLPKPIDPDMFIEEARAFHARFQEPLPDISLVGKRAGRKYEDGFSDEHLPSGDASGQEVSR
jgi:plasmid stability protein